MPLSGMNVERDFSVEIYDPLTGGTTAFAIITGFNKKQRTKSLESNAIDGTIRFAELPDGWEGSFDFDRASRALDDFIARAEAAYYAGVNVPASTILETITEVDGSMSQYRYEGCVFKLDDGGNAKKGELVKMKLNFKASKRKMVA